MRHTTRPPCVSTGRQKRCTFHAQPSWRQPNQVGGHTFSVSKHNQRAVARQQDVGSFRPFFPRGLSQPLERVFLEAQQPLRAQVVRCSADPFTFITRDEPLLPECTKRGRRVGRRQAQPCGERSDRGGSIEQLVEILRWYPLRIREVAMCLLQCGGIRFNL